MNLIRTKIGDLDFEFETKGGVFSAREIDPGTRLLAGVLRQDYGARRRILDLGCGYGVLGIVAAKRNPGAEVFMSDDSLRATRLTQRNVEINQTRNARVILSDGFSEITGKFDVILWNPPLGYGNELVEELLSECANHLNSGGEIYVVTQNRFKDLMKKWIGKYFAGFEITARGRQHFVSKATK